MHSETTRIMRGYWTMIASETHVFCTPRTRLENLPKRAALQMALFMFAPSFLCLADP